MREFIRILVMIVVIAAIGVADYRYRKYGSDRLEYIRKSKAFGTTPQYYLGIAAGVVFLMAFILGDWRGMAMLAVPFVAVMVFAVRSFRRG